MISMFLVGAPMSFILLFLGVYVLGVFLYFCFAVGGDSLLKISDERWLQNLEEKEDFEEILELAIPRHRSLNRHLNFLRLVVNVSPLLGLLGTVLGIVRSTGGLLLNDQNTLLAGISQSLITTAMGLIVSIPALFVHFFGRWKLEAEIFRFKRRYYQRRWN